MRASLKIVLGLFGVTAWFLLCVKLHYMLSAWNGWRRDNVIADVGPGFLGVGGAVAIILAVMIELEGD